MKSPPGFPTSDAGKSSESILSRVTLLRFRRHPHNPLPVVAVVVERDSRVSSASANESASIAISDAVSERVGDLGTYRAECSLELRTLSRS